MVIFMISLTAVSAGEDVNETLEITDDTNLSASPGTFTELQSKINQAREGSTITLDKDYSYSESSTLGVTITKSITINGNGHTLDGIGKSPILIIDTNMYKTYNFNNINFINGYTTGYINGYLVPGGAAVSCHAIESTYNFNYCNFINNIAPDCEGGAIFGEVANLNYCIFQNNHASIEGGAVSLSGGNVNNCVFENNHATGVDSSGGAISIENMYACTISQSRFIGNSADRGGAIFALTATGYPYTSPVISNNYFEKNRASQGGAVYFGGFEDESDMKFEIKNCNFVENSLTDLNEGMGAAIYGYMHLDIDHCDFTNNIVGNNAAIADAKSITNCNFNSNNDGFFVSVAPETIMKNNVMNANNRYDIEILGSPSEVKFDLNLVFANSVVVPNTKIELCQFIDGEGHTVFFKWFNSINVKFTNRDTRQITTENVWCDDNSKGFYYNCSLGEGVYDVTCNENLNRVKINDGVLTVDANTDFTLTAQNLTKYYRSPDKFAVTLINGNNRLIPGASVEIEINGQKYYRTTDKNGVASMNINLAKGNYTAKCSYGNAECNAKITVLTTLLGDDLTKYFRNSSQYYIDCLDTNGNKIASGNIEFNINGVFYTRAITNGVARMNINLAPGEYIITARNLINNEQHSNTIKVLTTIVENNDLTKYYKNDSQYSIRILDAQGNPVAKGVDVTFNINGVFYTRSSNESGHVKLNINLAPGQYIITANYNGLMASNNINVLSILEGHDVNMDYRDGTRYEVKLLDGMGNPNPGKNVTLNINGVFYTRATDSEGVAGLNINLMGGSYIITASYNGQSIANSIVISMPKFYDCGNGHTLELSKSANVKSSQNRYDIAYRDGNASLSFGDYSGLDLSDYLVMRYDFNYMYLDSYGQWSCIQLTMHEDPVYVLLYQDGYIYEIISDDLNIAKRVAGSFR